MMIFYFSGTGNTRWAAQKLSRCLGEELFSISEMKKGGHTVELKDGERLGFCFPVHGWRPPKLVREFISQLKITNADGHYCFALCTAGDNIGETMDIFERDLAKIGVHVDSMCSLIMPESYVGLPFMDVDKPEKELAKKKMADKELDTFIQMVSMRKKGKHNLVLGRWKRINSRVIGSYFVNHLITDKKFHVTDKCLKCGKCAEVCPVHDIDGGVGKLPEWRHTGDCLTCFACYHHCPSHAIEFGRMTRHKGQYYYNKVENKNQ